MNKTEERAKEWLESQGYNCLAFQNRNSPDFVTDTGLGFEVKKVRQNTIVFSSRQWEQLGTHPDVTILIFNGSDVPEAVVPFEQLDKPPSYYKKYRLVIIDLTRMRYKAQAKKSKDLRECLNLSQEELAKKLGVNVATISRWENGAACPSQLATRQLRRLHKKTEGR